MGKEHIIIGIISIIICISMIALCTVVATYHPSHESYISIDETLQPSSINSSIIIKEEIFKNTNIVNACHIEYRVNESIVGNHNTIVTPLYYTCYYHDGHNESILVQNFGDSTQAEMYIKYYYPVYKDKVYVI